MTTLSERQALAQLQRSKTAYQKQIKRGYEHAAQSCRNCPTPGVCCTDAHFVNVHITRLEAVAIRETLSRTPRLSTEAQRAVYRRAAAEVERRNLRSFISRDSFRQTYSCPLFEPGTGCLVHRRAKPAPCIQHACYDDWQDIPPDNLQWRAEHRIEQLNRAVYGAAWVWLPTPLWLTLIDPASDGSELEKLIAVWKTSNPPQSRATRGSRLQAKRSLPVIAHQDLR